MQILDHFKQAFASECKIVETYEAPLSFDI